MHGGKLPFRRRGVLERRFFGLAFAWLGGLYKGAVLLVKVAKDTAKVVSKYTLGFASAAAVTLYGISTL